MKFREEKGIPDGLSLEENWEVYRVINERRGKIVPLLRPNYDPQLYKFDAFLDEWVMKEKFVVDPHGTYLWVDVNQEIIVNRHKYSDQELYDMKFSKCMQLTASGRNEQIVGVKTKKYERSL